jgi:ATP sulfurylase
MGEADYRAVLRDMRLASGLPWTLPITFAVRGASADQLREGDDVALVTPREEPLGILHVPERFPYSPHEEARIVYGTDDPRHPGAADFVVSIHLATAAWRPSSFAGINRSNPMLPTAANAAP